tara:strand:+ start:91 stop:438 length:348 start_codon:yes stop_codon:yes gene_type:complete
MYDYTDLFLLGLLVIFIYKKPAFLKDISKNKLAVLSLILLNAYLLKTKGVSSGITMALIIIVILDDTEGFTLNNKEGFQPKIHRWQPAHFVGPCQIDLDRKLKIRSEEANVQARQ